MPEYKTPPLKHSKTLEQKLNSGSGPFSTLIQVSSNINLQNTRRDYDLPY